MKSETSEAFFALIDVDGNRRIPYKVNAAHGPYGYALHPEGLGNDPKAATYTETEKELVQEVVIHGRGVRAVVLGGPQDGQKNTVQLGKKSIRGYWLCPSKANWVSGAKHRPVNDGGAH